MSFRKKLFAKKTIKVYKVKELDFKYYIFAIGLLLGLFVGFIIGVLTEFLYINFVKK